MSAAKATTAIWTDSQPMPTTYQSEVLNFEKPGDFFGQLSEKRWEIVRACEGKGKLPVHEDVTTLAELGLMRNGQLVVMPLRSA